MLCCDSAPDEASAENESLKVGDIFRTHGEEYRWTHHLSAAEEKVMSHIETCRTEVLGGHVDTCAQCGHKIPSFNSCGDRHCPECQSFAQARWINGRKQRILPTKYFHAVFTLPSQLRPLARCNPKTVYDILFKSASQTLLELAGDPKYLGGMPGLTAVLHTWTRELDYHPHVHIIVSAGALSKDNSKWIPTGDEFLFPIRVVSRLFRGKFLDAIKKARQKGLLTFKGGCANLETKAGFSSLLNRLYGIDWVVYCKKPFKGPGAVFEYLGRYTHRVAISNQRLISIGDDAVTFYTKDGKTKTLHPIEFIRRFLLHILPAGFTKIRHFGLLAPCHVNTRLETAKAILKEANPGAAASLAANQERASQLLQKIIAEYEKPPVCPRCGCHEIIRTIFPDQRQTTPKRDTS